MFESVRPRRDAGQAAAVDIAPLIDIVFILLIFFLVTTTFVRDWGVEVDRPSASAVAPVPDAPLRVYLTAGDAVVVEGRSVDLAALERTVRGRAGEGVVVVPDAAASAGRLVAVMDAATRAGAASVSVAAERSEP